MGGFHYRENKCHYHWNCLFILFSLILILFEELGIVVLPQLRNKDPLAEWTVLSLLENSAEAVVGGRKNYFFFN